MNPSDVAPAMLGMTFIIVTGGVILLRPFMKRIAMYLEVLAEEKRRAVEAPAPQPDTERILAALEQLDDRMSRLEERQQFTDQLLSTRERRSLTEG